MSRSEPTQVVQTLGSVRRAV